MNVRIVLISTICMISSCAYAMQTAESFDAMLAAFRAKNPKKVVIIDGRWYDDPSSPAALAARAASEQRQQEQQQYRYIDGRAMLNLSNEDFPIDVDQRSQSSACSISTFMQ